MTLTENPKFCRGCPLLPKGVTAEVIGAEADTIQPHEAFFLTPSAVIGAAYGAIQFSERRVVRVLAAVTASNSPHYQPGDSFEVLFQTDREPDAVRNSIGACTAPRKNRVESVLKMRGACGVIT